MVSARQALFETLFSYLNNASALWGSRVQPLEVASTQLAHPYLTFFEAAGRRELVTARRNSALVVVSVKAVAKTMDMAFEMDAALSELMHDCGDQDWRPRLPFQASWRILTVTEDRTIYLEEKFAGAESIYHSGHQYVIKMEAR